MAKSALEQIQELQAKQDELRETATKEALEVVEKAIEDLNALGHNYVLSSGKPRARRGAKATGTLPPKYKHPKEDITWSGKGPTPKWLKDLEADGRDRDDFLID